MREKQRLEREQEELEKSQRMEAQLTLSQRINRLKEERKKPRHYDSDSSVDRGSRTDSKKSIGMSAKKVFDYQEKQSFTPGVSMLSASGQGTSMALRKHPTLMTPFMHKVLLNLRITLGVPARQFKESDVKLDLPESLCNSEITIKSEAKPDQLETLG